jgi:pyruvate formate lyase activating enzyme
MTTTSERLPPIRGFIPSTLIDWPGRIAAILFLPSCNLRCAYCHAGPLLGAAQAEVIPFAEVRRYLESKKGWIDGVVICGGEPTLQPKLAALCDELHGLGLAVKLDTNGTLPEVLGALIEERRIDAASMDIKTALDGRMVEVARCEVDLEAIERSVGLLIAAGSGKKGPGLEVEFRTTCCPAFVDAAAVEWIARHLAERAGPAGVAYVLQRFDPQHALEPELREMKPYSAGEMESLLATARRFNPRSRLRNA